MSRSIRAGRRSMGGDEREECRRHPGQCPARAFERPYRVGESRRGRLGGDRRDSARWRASAVPKAGAKCSGRMAPKGAPGIASSSQRGAGVRGRRRRGGIGPWVIRALGRTCARLPGLLCRAYFVEIAAATRT